jgi:hypothetical protein
MRVDGDCASNWKIPEPASWLAIATLLTADNRIYALENKIHCLIVAYEGQKLVYLNTMTRDQG